MASRASELPALQPNYRPAVPFPATVATNCHIYLDEKLYRDALDLLADLVTPGASHPNHLYSPSFAPDPFHLEIVCNLLVHPQFTSHPGKHAKAELPAKCITLLRDVLAILGPLNGRLSQAFTFNPPEGRRGRRATSSDSDEDEDHIGGIVANKGRLCLCAKDFWHVVGWSLNCSVACPKRWKYWKVWLDYMLDVLDADWDERQRLDDAAVETRITGDKRGERYENLGESMLVKYLAGGSTVARRAVGAIFTDGGVGDLVLYPEVYPNETEGLNVKNRQKRKREEAEETFDCVCGKGEERRPCVCCDKCNRWQHSLYVGIDLAEADKDDFDYLCTYCTAGHSMDDMSEPPSSQASVMTDRAEEVEPDGMLGGAESIALRQRLICQLSKVAFILPDCFIPFDDLYRQFVTSIMSLPIPAFSLLMSASDSSHLRPLSVYVSLLHYIFPSTLPKNTTTPRDIGYTNDDLCQDVIEQCFLPYSARTSSMRDNAKLSILAENAFRILIKSTLEDFDMSCYHTPNLHAAVETGIKAREAKVRRRGNEARKDDVEDRQWLDASSARLRSLVTLVERMNS